MRFLVDLALVLSLSVLSSSCLPTRHRSLESVPDRYASVRDGVTWKHSKHFDRMVLEHVDIHVHAFTGVLLEPQREVYSPPAAGERFWVKLIFWPRADTFSFTPAATRLHLADGAEVAPTHYVPPSHYEELAPSTYDPKRSHSDADWAEFSRLLSRHAAAELEAATTIEFDERRTPVAVDLAFPVPPPHPSDGFRLSVDGLRQGGQRYPVPGISFVERVRTYWMLDELM